MTRNAIRHGVAQAFLPVLVTFLLDMCAAANAQNTPEMRQILSRLDRLEKQNQTLTEEVRALRQEVSVLRAPSSGATSASVSSTDGQVPAAQLQAGEESAVQQNRIEELAQTKVEASQKFPIRITGMALFNAYVNGRFNNQSTNPTIASLQHGDATGGGTLRQSTLGLLFNGPLTLAGGKVSGSIYMGFFGWATASLNHGFRIPTEAIKLDFRHTSLMFGQAKPIISPPDPHSLAQLAVSPLTSAGNPWLWQPQIRLEQRGPFGNSSGF